MFCRPSAHLSVKWQPENDMTNPITTEQKAAILAGLQEAPDGVLEVLASRLGVPVQAVLDCLPSENSQRYDQAAFEDIWADLSTWGDITFIVHTEDGVFESKGSLPPGKEGSGYFNIHGDSPISGHIKRARCAAIYFVDRPFFGKRSCSVQFVNLDGGVMFKVFVGREQDRSLKLDQVAKFEKLRQRTA